MDHARKTVTDLLTLADIKTNGDRPFDIQVHDDRFYRRVLSQRELGLGESYMDGWWDALRVDELIAHILSTNIRSKIIFSPALLAAFVRSTAANRQNFRRAPKNASRHYNIGNDLYQRMLGQRMIYSCAYWKDAKTLDEAQEAKLDLICRKLHLKKGMSLLDIGCGWGGFAEFAANKYGVEVTGITPAAEQVKLAKERTRGLPVTILQQDYREVTGSFDRIVSIGMLEHVGPKNYRTFFLKNHALLKDGGLMLHHFIGRNKSVRITDPWIDRYIFPGGVIPTLAQISRALERLLIAEDVHNFGPYY
ncbi:MAG TPA: cyclopropane fatty acyl phospholipid synthase, partial [Verrucomicrobiae bacterium]|nr:cyclopropane fatty acyl phospholipid synthase [Verrucomicrobiae bacterium]